MKTSFPVWNGFAPKEGPKALPVSFDLRVANSLTFDLLLENTEGVIQFVQSVYVDNSTNTDPLILIFGQTQQRVVVPATSQGIWPVISPDQTQVTISTTPNSGAVGQVIFLNVPMPLTQWGPQTINVNPTINVNTEPYAATLSDAGSDTASTIAATFLAANADRRGLVIVADADNAEPVQIESGGFVLVTLLPGQSWTSGAWCPVEALDAQAATGADFSWHEYE